MVLSNAMWMRIEGFEIRRSSTRDVRARAARANERAGRSGGAADEGRQAGRQAGRGGVGWDAMRCDGA